MIFSQEGVAVQYCKSDSSRKMLHVEQAATLWECGMLGLRLCSELEVWQAGGVGVELVQPIS